MSDMNIVTLHRFFRYPFSLLRPFPLAFLILPFSFAMQVYFSDVRYGSLAYILIAAGFMIIFSKKALIKIDTNRNISRFNYLDIFIIIFLIDNVLLIIYGFLANGYSAVEAIKLMFIYVLSGPLYFYYSRNAKENEIRTILLAITITSAIVGVYWLYESIMKIAFGSISDFQRMSVAYRSIRSGFETSEMNILNVIRGYVTYGLLETHTASAALVAIGAFSAVALIKRPKHKYIILILYYCLFVLVIGGGKTAFISCIVLFPLISKFTINQRIQLSFFKFYLPIVIFVILFGIVLKSMSGMGAYVLEDRLDLLNRSLTNILNLSVEKGFSWFWLYIRNIDNYFYVCSERPLVVLFGQGLRQFGHISFPCGGDFGLMDHIAIYGIPMAILFLFSCFFAMITAFRNMLEGSEYPKKVCYLLFGFSTIFFILMSFFHYSLFSSKAIFPIFYFALALLRRFNGRDYIFKVKNNSMIRLNYK